MRKSTLITTLAAVVAAASLVAYAAAPATPAPATPAPAAAAAKAVVGKPAPAFTLQDANGKTVNLADYKGKVVVLEWINYDCPINTRVVNSKFISTVYDKFKDKVTWLAVDSAAAHTKTDYDKAIKEWKLAYTYLNDAKGVVGKLYDAKTTPQMYVINAEGVLVYNGAIDNDPEGTKVEKDRVNYLDKALTELLAGKPVSLSETKPYGCSVKY